MTINLLPPELRRDMPPDWKKLAPRVLASIAVGALMLSYMSLLGANYYLQAVHEDLDKQLAEWEPEVRQLAKAENEIKMLETKIKAYRNITENRISWSKLLKALSDIQPAGVSLTNIDAEDNKQIVLKGHSLDLDSVGLFLNGLTGSPVFNGGILTRSESLLLNDVEIISFEITVNIKQEVGKNEP